MKDPTRGVEIKDSDGNLRNKDGRETSIGS